jgi:hypothetical protein
MVRELDASDSWPRSFLSDILHHDYNFSLRNHVFVWAVYRDGSWMAASVEGAREIAAFLSRDYPEARWYFWDRERLRSVLDTDEIYAMWEDAQKKGV